MTGKGSAAIDFAGIRREALEIAPEALRIVEDVLLSGQVLQGAAVAHLERDLAILAGRRHAVCVGSATDALYFSLLALGVGAGDDVLVPDMSFIATASAVKRLGARPVFVDIDPSCHLDLAAAQGKVTSRTRAMVFVNLFGSMSDPDLVESFGRRHGLAIVEDAAQSFGASFRGRPSGSVGEASVFSFDPMKVLSAPGSGGAFLTDNDALASCVRSLRYHGREDGRYVRLGFNSQMPTLTAALLSLKLKHAPGWIAKRQATAARIMSALSDLPIEFPRKDVHSTHAWQKFLLLTDSRDELLRHLAQLHVPSLVHYQRPLHREAMFEPSSDDDYPQACRHSRRALSLPIHAHLTGMEIDTIIAAVRSHFTGGGERRTEAPMIGEEVMRL